MSDNPFTRNDDEVSALQNELRELKARIAAKLDGFGPGDDFCVMWSFFDCLPNGQDDWWPKLDYGAQ